MTTTTKHKTLFLNAIANIAESFLTEVTYSEEKENQLRSLGFVNSEFIADAEDYRNYHTLAEAYVEKYPTYIYLTERQYLYMKKSYELHGYNISVCKVNIPDEVLAEMLKIEIEMGIIDQSTNVSNVRNWYDEIQKMSDKLYHDIITSGRGLGKDASMRHITDSILYGPSYPVVLNPITKPLNMVRMADGTIRQKLPTPQLTTGTDTISEKKIKHLERMPLTLAEIRKDYPSALIYLRDNVADKPGETTNHLIALKVEGGYFILTHWES